MFIHSSLGRFLLAGLAVFLLGKAAPAQQQADAPYLTYHAGTDSETGGEFVNFTLYGFTHDPSVDANGNVVDQATYDQHTIYAFSEKSFEQAGGSVYFTQTPDNTWTAYSDLSISGGPIYPTDPVGGFSVTTSVPTDSMGNPIYIFDQTFSFYNKPLNSDGTPQPGSLIATGKPCPDRNVCYGTEVSGVAPEPSGLLPVAFTGSGILGLLLYRRLRRA